MTESKEYWNSRYKNGNTSGYGSYGEQLQKKLDWLKGLEVNTISEIGCGDFNFGKRLLEIYPHASYVGSDISEVIVEKNRALYPFAVFTINTEPQPADLILCVDVLFHIHEEEEAEKLLTGLEKTWTKYLAITAYEEEQERSLSPHICIRKFDYKRFGEPIIREIVEEDGSLYFYLFKK